MLSYEEIVRYAFLVFAVVAIIVGSAVGYLAYNAHGWSALSVADINGYVTLIMLILGIIVGLLSITAEEVTPFFMATIALVAVGVAGNVWNPLLFVQALEWLYYIGNTILNYFVAFAIPAAVTMSMKAIWAIAKEK